MLNHGRSRQVKFVPGEQILIFTCPGGGGQLQISRHDNDMFRGLNKKQNKKFTVQSMTVYIMLFARSPFCFKLHDIG